MAAADVGAVEPTHALSVASVRGVEFVVPAESDLGSSFGGCLTSSLGKGAED